MTGPELRTIRLALGLSVIQMGRALGYAGSDVAVRVQVARWETGARDVPVQVGLLAAMYGRFGVPDADADE